VFANWAAGHLGLAMEFTDGAYCLVPRAEVATGVENVAPPSRSGLGARLSSIRKRRDHSEEADQPSYATPTELAAALLQRLSEQERPPDLAPRDQPERVHQIAAILLNAYQVDQGNTHIAGCHFEDVPFLRVTTLAQDADEPAFTHALYDAGGAPVSETLAGELGLANTKDLDYHPTGRPPGIDSAANLPVGVAQPAAISAVVWAKRVSGNLQFTIGDASARAPFEGWAGNLKAQPVPCPLTGNPTWHLTALGNGKIAAAEEVAECELTGRVVLRRDLVTCAVTGQRVARDLCQECPTTGEPSLREEFAECDRCGQRVSRASLTAGRCGACRTMRRPPPTDPSLLAILAAHPSLAALGHWRLAETRTVYLLRGAKLLARYLIVLDRHTLSVLRAVRLGPLGATIELTPAERSAIVGS
jgi:hypothetical protein